MSSKKYDVVIIGSGLGGLLCGHILSEEGFSVCIIEKNKQIGGSLQTFVRDRCIFDTGIHYIGGLQEGQPLHQYFKYFKIIDKLKLRKLDEAGFDRFGFTGDPKIYFHAQGYDRFIDTLSGYFPEERENIIKYCDSIKEFCKKFPLYNLEESDQETLDTSFLQINAKEHIESITPNKKLQEVLGASNSLYAGEGDKSPFYMHALIANSYIESSYRCIDGGSQITRILTKSIFENGGVILKHAEVKKMVMNGEILSHVQLADGREVRGEKFISNIHPANMLDMLDTDRIRNAYRNRITNLENTVSVFIVNIVFKKNTFKYLNYNYYHCEHDRVWSTAAYTEESWPEGYGLFSSASSRSEEYADGITLMAYMRYDEMVQWEKTFNTTLQTDFRGESYEKFKKDKAEKLIEYANRQFPDLKASIKNYYASTPLTYRDYIGTKDGSLYGILKDYRDPLRTFISPKTRISNLFITGQNLNMHGVYGVTVAAVKTCFEFLDPKYLFDKIKNA